LLQWILYLVVFLIEILIFWRVRSRAARQIALLAGSYLLYCTWGLWFAAILLLSTLMNYCVGAWLRRQPTGFPLFCGLLLNLALLGTFKYLPEFAGELPFSSLQRFAHVALPLGISFWTFQAMSYLFDQYRSEDLDPTLIEFALYMAFFPITISGPVCSLPEMLPQFRSDANTRWHDIERGFSRIAIGVLMMQFARLLGHGIFAGDGINSGFDRLQQWSGPDVWCLAAGYGLQLFFDFAGYSHIAIGAAQAMGFVIPENFAHPFTSTSVSVFWTRWHMSLSFWIRDYVFLPLAVLRREVWWRNAVLVISMMIFGVWHRASLLFVVWGFYHGALLVLHRQLQQLQRRFSWDSATPLWNLLGWFATAASVSLGWIFFRSASWTQARTMLSSLFSPSTYGSHAVTPSLYALVAALAIGYAVVALCAALLDRYAAPEKRQASGVIALLARKRWAWLPALYILALLAILAINFTQGASAAQFMYRTF
jgi:alginate O-acetyltransferase complex protein AlgI